jgi:hypothetical protein
MTTKTNSDNQPEIRSLSESEIDAVVGGTVGIHAYAVAVAARDKICASQLLPPDCYPGCRD